MSETMTEPASPDYLETPTRGKGQQRPNRLLLVILVVVVLAIGLLLIEDAHDRTLKDQEASARDAEIRRVSTFAEPPVKRPIGPDVAFLENSPVASQGYPMATSPMPVDEAAKQAHAKKVAALEAALKAPTALDKFGRQRQSMQAPAQSGYGNPPGIPGVNGLVPPPPPDGDGYGTEDMNQQAHKRAFLSQTGDSGIYLKHSRAAPLSPYEIKAGSIIPGVMIGGINSDLPGQIIGQVRESVYDSATHTFLLIPAGAKLVGTYDSDVSGGQERVLVAWNRIIFPDSSSISLDSMPGADKSGFAGFHDKVDNHYLRTFGQAALLSLFSAGIQLSQPRGAVTGTYNSQQIMAAAIGQQLGQLGMQIARRNLAIQPTLEISPGFKFSIMVTKDMILPPWQGHPVARNVANAENQADTED